MDVLCVIISYVLWFWKCFHGVPWSMAPMVCQWFSFVLWFQLCTYDCIWFCCFNFVPIADLGFIVACVFMWRPSLCGFNGMSLAVFDFICFSCVHMAVIRFMVSMVCLWLSFILLYGFNCVHMVVNFFTYFDILTYIWIYLNPFFFNIFIQIFAGIKCAITSWHIWKQ